MADIPPSYYQSMNPSVLDIIAPYLDTRSLHTLALVSRFYNETFMPHLWGSPAAHFVSVTGPSSPGLSQNLKHDAAYNDSVYQALTRFKKTLKFTRESTRRLTHTLYLPAANSEIYSGPNASWLREILDGLPNLQSLCVSGLPFFDHHSLVAVDRPRLSQSNTPYKTWPVKLLLAAKEANTTSIGLALMLPHLSALVYLDLSYTNAARDINVLSSFTVLNDLRVLKLRGIGLRDMEAKTLANAIGLRVRLLDIADNLLGDVAITSLLESCFTHPRDPSSSSGPVNGSNHIRPSDLRRHLESWPVGLPPAPDFLSLDTLRSADFDQNLLVQLTNPLTGRLAFEDIPDSGLTHLYINGNPAVTVEGIRGLLETGRLHVLDVGDTANETAVDRYVQSVRTARKRHGRTTSIGSGGVSVTTSRRSGSRTDVDNEAMSYDDIQFPGTERLIPALKERASKNLTYLRIEHSIVTKGFKGTGEGESAANGKAELAASRSQPAELGDEPGVTTRVEAPGSNYQPVEVPGSRYLPVELPSDPDVFELDSTSVFRAELPGDLIHFAISPAIGDKPEVPIPDVPLSPIRADGAYAPEVVENGQHKNGVGEDAALSVSGSDAVQRSISPISVPSPVVPPSATNGTSIDAIVRSQRSPTLNPPLTPPMDRQSQLQNCLQKRPGVKSPILHPSSLPNLRTLILTNLPAKVAGTSSPVLAAIRDFIAACASEAHIAVLKARTNYSLPPGRARAAAERKHAQSLFALRTIVLEVLPVQEAQRDWRHARQRLSMLKSATGDLDSEALWSAAENDFSFFGETGEEHDECGIYDYEPGKYFPSVHLDDKFAVTGDDVSSVSRSGPSSIGGLNSPTATIFRSPLELPLGRNRRSSAEMQNRDGCASRSSPPGSAELSGDLPTLRSLQAQQQQQQHQQIPTSAPQLDHERHRPPPPMVDLVEELSKWRRERKTAYETEVGRRSHANGAVVVSNNGNVNSNSNRRLADSEVFVEGHWAGKIQVIRNARPYRSAFEQGRLERTGQVDVYGNYYEDGYRYS